MEAVVKKYKDRFRIFLIIYTFSKSCNVNDRPHLKRLFESEVRIQKLDFLLRNPDYLCYELLLLAQKDSSLKIEIKDIVEDIYLKNEPDIRKEEMLRFFFGAYEDIDEVIAFLVSIDFICFESKKTTNLRNTVSKKYYITEYAISKFEREINGFSAFGWYVNRCELIKKYFGSLSGSELKIAQYQIEEYKDTSMNDYIKSINKQVKIKFQEIYAESL